MNDPMAFVRSGQAGTLSMSAADARLGLRAVLLHICALPHSLMPLCVCVMRVAGRSEQC